MENSEDLFSNYVKKIFANKPYVFVATCFTLVQKIIMLESIKTKINTHLLVMATTNSLYTIFFNLFIKHRWSIQTVLFYSYLVLNKRQLNICLLSPPREMGSLCCYTTYKKANKQNFSHRFREASQTRCKLIRKVN